MSASSTPPTPGLNQQNPRRYVQQQYQLAVAQIPAQLTGTHVQYYIIAYDPSGNRGINKNSGSYFVYTVSPSGQPSTWEYVAIAVGMGALLSGVLVFTRRRMQHPKSTDLKPETSKS